MFSYQSTALFHSPPGHKKELKNSESKPKFIRLDSLEGNCHFHPRKIDLNMEQNQPKMDPKMDKRESKWFGHYSQDPQFQNFYPSQNHWCQFQPQNYQVPFNLTKGQFEIWPSQAQNCQGQMTYFQSQPQEEQIFSKFLDWGSALATSMASIYSNLNPNAKAFIPLNPHAKEFKPKTVPETFEIIEKEPEINEKMPEIIEKEAEIIQKGEPVTPPNEENVVLKHVNQRKCTPWIPKNSVNFTENSENLENSENSEDSEDSESEDEDTCGSRPRLLSVCSSDNEFIQFESESPKNGGKKFDFENSSNFLKNFIKGVDSDEECEDSDEDWDCVEDYNDTIDAIFLDQDDELAKLGLKSQWHVQDTNSDTVDHCCAKIESHPEAADLDYEEVLEKIKMANEKWDNLEKSEIKRTQKIQFSEPLVTSVQEEDPDLAEDLRLARVGDQSFAQKRADQDRLNRLLGPIFEPDHRDKIRSYIEKCYLKST